MIKDKLEPSFELFQEMLGHEFTVQWEEQVIRFQLVEVAKLKLATTKSDLKLRQTPFALEFKELTNFRPGQGTFLLDTRSGMVEMFLVPVGSGEYEAIFN